MNLDNLNLSTPMLDISGERAIALGELYDDFGKRCGSAVESRVVAAARV